MIALAIVTIQQRQVRMLRICLGDISDDLPLDIAGDSLMSAAGFAPGGPQPNVSSSSSSSQAAPATCQPASSFQLARELLHREALRSRDDSFARTLRKHMAEDTKKRKAADGPEAVVLRDVLEASKQQEIRRRADAALDQQAAQLGLEKKEAIDGASRGGLTQCKALGDRSRDA